MLRGIARAYSHTHDGGRMLVTIVGERGSGRSRTLREIRSMTELAGALLLEPRLPAGSSDVVAAVARALREELGVRRSIGPLSPVDAADASEAPDDLAATLATTLTATAAVMPLVLLVDDIDDDPAAVVALAGLLQSVDAPWLAIMTSRQSTASAAAMVARSADAHTAELYCEHFDHESVTALLRALQREEPEALDVGWLVERTHGLPLLLREAIEAAMRCGALVLEDGRLRRADEIGRAADEYAAQLPLSVPEILSLSEPERAALATCALLGLTAPEALLERLAVTDTCLSRLARLRLVRRDNASVTFESRLVHEASLADARAKRIDERHAPVLAEIVPGAIDDGLRPPPGTIDLLVRTAPDEARRLELIGELLACASRLATANEYYQAALIMRSCYDAGVAITDDHDRLAAWFDQYVGVLHALGRVDEQRRVIDDFLRRHPAENATPALVPMVARAMLWRAEDLERSKLMQRAIEMLDAADVIIERVAEPELAASLRHRAVMGRARVYSVADRNDDALALLRRLLDEIDSDAHLPVAFDALLVFGRVADTPEQRAEAESRIEAMLDRFERDGRERLAVQMRAARIGLHTGDDDFDLREPEIREIVEQTKRCSLPRTETNAWVWLAMIHSERGEQREALRAIDHAIEARWRVGSIALWQLAMITRAQILMLDRRDDEALEAIAQVELDAETYGRPCRRFLIDVVKCIIAVRRGEWQSGTAGLAVLAETGNAERFDAVRETMLVVEGEILLHSHSIEREQARDYARRVLLEDPQDLDARRLLPVALAVVARAHDDAGTAARGRVGASDPLIQELGRRVTESVALWIERRAEANAEHALHLLRAHAPRALPAEDLAAIGARLPQGLAGPSWHHCEVQTLGSMRVIDATGAERGGRHFGQHKSDSKPKKMLAALAVAAIVGRRLKRERLIEMVWGESVAAETAVNNFHVTLSGLRQVVGDVVDFDGSSYMLNTSLVRVDALWMLALVDEAAAVQRAGLHYKSYDLLRQAIALVNGEFLDGIYDEWTDVAREIVRAKSRFARLRVAEIALARGESDVARREIGMLLDADPLDEEAEYLALSILRADGERLRALRELDRFTAALAAEYGTEPSARLRSLRGSIALAD